MYIGRQQKNEAGNKVSRLVECGTRQRVKMRDGRIIMHSNNVFENNWINRNNSIQRYTENNGFKISENNQYAITDSEKQALYLNKKIENVPPPSPKNFFKIIEQTNSFDKYQPNAKLISGEPTDVQGNYPPTFFFHDGPNDCGYYAGALANDNFNWDDGAGFKLMKDKNVSHNGTLTDRGMNADPNIGEAYFIYPSVPDAERNYTEARHHVATVVAQDGADRITSEADCGDKRTMPDFEMYGTKQNTEQEKMQTFLGKHKWYFNSWRSNFLDRYDAKVAVLTPSRRICNPPFMSMRICNPKKNNPD